jgi:hypothetical protein
MRAMSLMQLVVPVLAALVAAALAHLFTRVRDRENRRREQRIDYLVSAFRGLAKANHHPRLYEVAEDVEQAVADIQLFGSPKQVQLARQFATALGTTQEADMDDLLNELRDSLRQELGRKKINGNLVWLKISRGKEKAG